jgi:hypothetical protein
MDISTPCRFPTHKQTVCREPAYPSSSIAIPMGRTTYKRQAVQARTYARDTGTTRLKLVDRRVSSKSISGLVFLVFLPITPNRTTSCNRWEDLDRQALTSTRARNIQGTTECGKAGSAGGLHGSEIGILTAEYMYLAKFGAPQFCSNCPRVVWMHVKGALYQHQRLYLTKRIRDATTEEIVNAFVEDHISAPRV